MNRRRPLHLLLIGTLCASSAAWGQGSFAPIFEKQRVTFKSGSLTLTGYVLKPPGAGPFPAVVWNHGSERNPNAGPQFDSVAAIFVPAGYVVLAPVRRGHGQSEGEYMPDVTIRERQARGGDAANRLSVRLLETEQLDDQLAGLNYLKALPYVDTTRLVVAGCSYGGIQALLAAERGAGFKAAVPISPAALSWQGNPYLQERMKSAAARIRIPVFLIQPPEDASLEPARVLGPILQKSNRRGQTRVYPATLPEAERGHCFGGAKGMHVWAGDAVSFLKDVVR